MKQIILNKKQKAIVASRTSLKPESGSAMVIALLIMALLMVFVGLAISRTTTEVQIQANDNAEGRTYEAAQAALEVMTRKFNEIFDIRFTPTAPDLDNVRNFRPTNLALPAGTDLSTFTFNDQIIDQIGDRRGETITDGPYRGLFAIRTRWRLGATVTENASGTQVRLQREFLNNQLPLFQFTGFSDDDLTISPGPRFVVEGHVHTNGNLFVAAGQGTPDDGVYFDGRVTVGREIITDITRSNDLVGARSDRIFVRSASGQRPLDDPPPTGFPQLGLKNGSALNTGGSIGIDDVCNNPNSRTPAPSTPLQPPFNPMPRCFQNLNWQNIEPIFNGNLRVRVPQLRLPLRSTGTDNIEIIKRGQAGEPVLIQGQRYFNRAGIRVTLSDSQAQLPGCNSMPASGFCGVRLDGAEIGDGTINSTSQDQGYDPGSFPMTDGYETTRLNGNRFRPFPAAPGLNWTNHREVWIKIDLVGADGVIGAAAQDITRDILSLGVTEAPTDSVANFEMQNYRTTAGINDSRSIIQLQRFNMPGPAVPQDNGTPDGIFLDNFKNFNFVRTNNAPSRSDCGTVGQDVNLGFQDPQQHRHPVIINNQPDVSCIVPFPIRLFDTRESVWTDNLGTLNSDYPNKRIPFTGVMSIVQIDINNLRRFLEGEFDRVMPDGSVTPNRRTPYVQSTGRRLQSTDVQSVNGWVLYVSDRRGDRDNDGEYDMEDFLNPNGVIDDGEDVNRNRVQNIDYFGSTNMEGEAPRFTEVSQPDAAAVLEHRFFRRGVRLINGRRLPGRFNATTPSETRGLTVASENGIYVQGDYNTTGMDPSNPALAPCKSYSPCNTTEHVPASVVADAVTVLSNSWNDTGSFRAPFDIRGRCSVGDPDKRCASTTFYRFAVVSGSSQGSFLVGGGGGLNDRLRFTENWQGSGAQVNYTGSLVNIYNTRNFTSLSKGSGGVVYRPPVINYTFDESFRTPDRLPPSTPFAQYLQLTGFERIDN